MNAQQRSCACCAKLPALREQQSFLARGTYTPGKPAPLGSGPQPIGTEHAEVGDEEIFDVA